MKCHIFIATTQGLVAVQDIELIDDPDVMSIVCLNGTAQSLNISNAYHNFVKKGSGIIQNDFNGQSYRLDVSANIDHGNSWQLGFYLAHLLDSVDLLGGGIPDENDKIFCVTGEVNIKERKVKDVANIPIKLALANNQILTWQNTGFDVKFLLPLQTSSNDTLAPYKAYCTQVDNLKQLKSLLPEVNKAHVKKTQLIKQTTKELIQIPAYLSINKKALLLAGLSILLFILYLLNFTDKEIKQENEAYLDEAYQGNKVSTAIVGPYLIAHVRDKTFLNSGGKKCDNALSEKKLALNNGKFKALAHEKLCQLLFIAPVNTQQVLMFTRYEKKLFKLDGLNNTWLVKIPNNLRSDLYYVLLPLSKTLTDVQEADLNKEIKQITGPLTVKSISPILKKLSISQNVFQHQITTF